MKDYDEWITGTIILGLAGLLLFPLFFSLEFKPISSDLVVVLAVALPLEILGYHQFLAALRAGPLSLTVPLLAFTPVFTIVTSALIVGERITGSGGLGISLVTVGAYLLNANLANQNVLAPLKAIFSNRGSRKMFLVALIWSVTSAIGKKGVLIYGAIPFGLVLLFGIVVVFAVVSLTRVKTGRVEFHFQRVDAGLFLLGGVFMAGAEITHFVALRLAPVAYMISVKRLSMVFGVILGWLFFREENVKYRLLGASIMVAGVFFLYN